MIGKVCTTYNVTRQVRRLFDDLTVGWVYTRLVFKGAYVLSRFHEYEKEWEVLSELLDQKLFRRGRRGEWWERRALIEVIFIKAVSY
jgi:fanconi-associated nuclease 1